MDAIIPQYAAILLDHSRARQPHNDNTFFEALYQALINCLVDALNGKHRPQVLAQLLLVLSEQHSSTLLLDYVLYASS